MRWLNKKLGYEYDAGKHMWYKSYSKCHKAPTRMRTVLDGHVLKVPFNSLTYKVKERVTFPQYCSKCYKPCKLEWKFKHD